MKSFIFNKKTGTIDLMALVLIGVASLALFSLIMLPVVRDIFGVRNEADIYVSLNDQSSSIKNLLSAKTGKYYYLEIFSLFGMLENSDQYEEEISTIAGKLDIKIITYNEDGNIEKIFGKRDIGNKIQIDVPYPGGEFRKIEIICDIELPEEKQEDTNR